MCSTLSKWVLRLYRSIIPYINQLKSYFLKPLFLENALCLSFFPILAKYRFFPFLKTITSN